MDHEIHLDLDPASDYFKELQDGYLNDKTYTIERDGITYTGCRIKSVRLEGPGNDVRGYVTLMAHHEQDYSDIEARMLAWLDDNQRFGGDPFDPDATSFYNARYRKPFAFEKLNLHPAQYEFFKDVGAHYQHKMEYAKGGPWTRPGVGFYPNEKFRFGELEMKNWKFKSVHPKDIDFEELGESVTRQNPLALVRGQFVTEMTHLIFQRTATGNVVYDDGTVRNDNGDIVVLETPPAAYNNRSMNALVDEAAPVYVEELKTVTTDENYVVIHKSILDKAMACAIGRPMTGKWKATMGGGRVYRNVPTKDLAKWVKWAKDVKAAKWDGNERRKVTFEVNLPTI